MSMQAILFISIVAASSSGIASAAVDCHSPRTRQQRTVCANPVLIEIDQQLTLSIQKVVAASSEDERKQLETDQHSWESDAGGCWDRVDCIKKRYGDRIAALDILAEECKTKRLHNSTGRASGPANPLDPAVVRRDDQPKDRTQQPGLAPTNELRARDRSAKDTVASARQNNALSSAEMRQRKRQVYQEESERASAIASESEIQARIQADQRYKEAEDERERAAAATSEAYVQAQIQADREYKEKQRQTEEMSKAISRSSDAVESLEQEKYNLARQIESFTPSTEFRSAPPRIHVSHSEAMKADLKTMQDREGRLRKEIAPLQERLATLRVQAIGEGRKVLTEARQVVSTTEWNLLNGPMPNTLANMTKVCDLLSKAIESGDVDQVRGLTTDLRTYKNTLEAGKKLYSAYMNWESKQQPLVSSRTSEISVQGLSIGSTFSEVRRTLGASCGDLASAARRLLTPPMGYFDVRASLYLRYFEQDMEMNSDRCMTVAGQKRQTEFSLLRPSADQQAAYRIILDAGEAHEEMYRWAFLRGLERSRLRRVEIYLDRHSDSYLRETVTTLASKHGLIDQPTATETERFNSFKIQTRTFTTTATPGHVGSVRYETSRKFDSSHLVYFFADYRVWLTLTRVGGDDISMSVAYVDSQMAGEARKQRQAAKGRPSDF